MASSVESLSLSSLNEAIADAEHPTPAVGCGPHCSHSHDGEGAKHAHHHAHMIELEWTEEYKPGTYSLVPSELVLSAAMLSLDRAQKEDSFVGNPDDWTSLIHQIATDMDDLDGSKIMLSDCQALDKSVFVKGTFMIQGNQSHGVGIFLADADDEDDITVSTVPLTKQAVLLGSRDTAAGEQDVVLETPVNAVEAEESTGMPDRAKAANEADQ